MIIPLMYLDCCTVGSSSCNGTSFFLEIPIVHTLCYLGIVVRYMANFPRSPKYEMCWVMIDFGFFFFFGRVIVHVQLVCHDTAQSHLAMGAHISRYPQKRIIHAAFVHFHLAR